MRVSFKLSKMVLMNAMRKKSVAIGTNCRTRPSSEWRRSLIAARMCCPVVLDCVPALWLFAAAYESREDCAVGRRQSQRCDGGNRSLHGVLVPPGSGSSREHVLALLMYPAGHIAALSWLA